MAVSRVLPISRLLRTSRALRWSSVASTVDLGALEVPVVDIRALRDPGASPADRLVVAKTIGAACETIGFLVITNHGVPESVIDGAWKDTHDFFDLPLDKKLGPDSFLLMTDEYPYGYSPFGGEVLSKGKELEEELGAEAAKKGDMKEMFAVGAYNEAAAMPLPRYPSEPGSMGQSWRAYYGAMEDLSQALMRGFALSLDLPENWFEDKTDRHASSLRALNYPTVDQEPEPGQTRASAHTDYGVLTILKSGGPGLQVKLLDGQWHDVPFLEDAYVVNLGDLMSRWTNDKWRSTPHRVVVPSAEVIASSSENRRQSMAFFCNLNMDADVATIPTCISPTNPAKYPPTKAGDHLMAKHRASTQGILDDSWMKDIAK